MGKGYQDKSTPNFQWEFFKFEFPTFFPFPIRFAINPSRLGYSRDYKNYFLQDSRCFSLGLEKTS
jgi:hypothetical protein